MRIRANLSWRLTWIPDRSVASNGLPCKCALFNNHVWLLESCKLLPSESFSPIASWTLHTLHSIYCFSAGIQCKSFSLFFNNLMTSELQASVRLTSWYYKWVFIIYVHDKEFKNPIFFVLFCRKKTGTKTKNGSWRPSPNSKIGVPIA